LLLLCCVLVLLLQYLNIVVPQDYTSVRTSPSQAHTIPLLPPACSHARSPSLPLYSRRSSVEPYYSGTPPTRKSSAGRTTVSCSAYTAAAHTHTHTHTYTYI
jgi:hypothetical protein